MITNKDSVQTQILEARQLFPFRAYKDVQLLHYTVPPQVTFASFQYKANGSFNCPAKTIAIYLQYGSYPVMNLQNATYPDHFAVQRLYLYNLTLLSNFVPVMLNISNPLPGNWYAAAFLIENTDRIAQKGLFTPCLSWLSSSLKVNVVSEVTDLLHQQTTVQKVNGSQIYRFFGSKNSWISEISIKDCLPNEFGNCPAVIRARQLGLPSASHESVETHCNDSNNCNLKIIPIINDWNYISIHSLVPELKFSLTINTESCADLRLFEDESLENQESFNEIDATDVANFNDKNETNSFRVNSCWLNIPLTRISLPTNLAFEYNLPPDEDDSYPFVLNISNSKYTLTSFEVFSTVDIGGTLVIELAVTPLMNLSHINVTVLGCLSYGIRPSFEDVDCIEGRSLSVNTSSWEHRFSNIFVPYPEAGTWYLRLKTFCYSIEPGNSSISPAICDLPKTSVFLRIRSTPCILGHCGSYGTCYQYVSGGLIFSTCNCIAGWKGWGCTDNSSARSDGELILDVLLLTLSNLLFLPAIVLSIYRKYFTEAFVYFATMVSSSFYHACDAEVYSYCLIRLSVLQFCDFYSAILSVWVTLIAMAKLPYQMQSFIHMAGAVGVALGVEYDRTGLWVFALPAGMGLVILLTSWVTRCYKKRLCYPARRIWLSCLLPGAVLATSGLVIYAFFETKDNYPFVHSAWHATIALSILFLLPKGKSDCKNTPEPTSTCSYIRVGDIPDLSHPVGTPYAQLLAPTP
ncbi:post-GPI attachment to proteins factor 6-like [Uloborus diversus]|uniref:post-GPI attachment to proteins factor 6-like n=1 Tax=Uloborus diversus TaxID=327109 RepID=UPI00240A25BA|nr:post-GPI attachment to proteins factor 6-like [Uloborus diversus]